MNKEAEYEMRYCRHMKNQGGISARAHYNCPVHLRGLYANQGGTAEYNSSSLIYSYKDVEGFFILTI